MFPNSIRIGIVLLNINSIKKTSVLRQLLKFCVNSFRPLCRRFVLDVSQSRVACIFRDMFDFTSILKRFFKPLIVELLFTEGRVCRMSRLNEVVSPYK